MELLVLGLSHKTAPVDIRERFAISEEALPHTAGRARELGCVESFVISTCNRVEVYAACADGASSGLVERLPDVLAAPGDAGALRRHAYRHHGKEALHHLFRVAASLDSMVVGEPQILGQMKTAYETCRAAGLTGPALNRAVERAFSVAKKIRNETGIGRASVSISSVAVDLAKQIFGDLSRRVVALVGAGKMGELAARHLVAAGVADLLVANRSFERANDLAGRLGGHPRQLEELPRLLVEADIVVTSTGARGYLVDRKEMKRAMKARKYRPIFLVDIAVPRNVDPRANDLDGVYVYDVDDLTGIADTNLDARRREAEHAEELVADEAIRFLREQRIDSVKPTIVALRRHADAIKKAELDRASGALNGLTEKQLRSVERLADGIVNKLLHDVMTGLKRAASDPDQADLADAVRRLYHLDPEDP